MKMVYRGVQYDYTPACVEVQDDVNVGHYRGHEVHFHSLKFPGKIKHLFHLVYRGAGCEGGACAS